jgi:Ricin-type beta-trefoil lectin domain
MKSPKVKALLLSLLSICGTAALSVGGFSSAAEAHQEVIIESGAGKCLDVHRPDITKDGAKVQVWNCNGSAQQKWKIEGNTIKSIVDQCLDVHRPDILNDGGKVQTWGCNGSLQQRWKIEGNTIRNGVDQCLDVHIPDQRKNGGKVQTWGCNGSIQQTWFVRPAR